MIQPEKRTDESLEASDTSCLSGYVAVEETITRLPEHSSTSAIPQLGREPGNLTIGVCLDASFNDWARGACGQVASTGPTIMPGSLGQSLVSGVHRAADVAGIRVLHLPSRLLSATPGSAYEEFLRQGIDGLILAPGDGAFGDISPEAAIANGQPAEAGLPYRVASRLVDAGVPAVLLRESGAAPVGCGRIGIGETDAVHRALTYLWDAGHRRIAYCSLRLPGYIRRCRYEAYTDFLKQRDAFDPGFVTFGIPGPWDSALDTLQMMLQQWRRMTQPPTAVFCADERGGHILLAAARSFGYAVPEELSIVGVETDNADTTGEVMFASVSSEILPAYRTGCLALSAITELLRGGIGASILACSPLQTYASPALRERGTIAPVSSPRKSRR